MSNVVYYVRCCRTSDRIRRDLGRCGASIGRDEFSAEIDRRTQFRKVTFPFGFCIRLNINEWHWFFYEVFVWLNFPMFQKNFKIQLGSEQIHVKLCWVIYCDIYRHIQWAITRQSKLLRHTFIGVFLLPEITHSIAFCVIKKEKLFIHSPGRGSCSKARPAPPVRGHKDPTYCISKLSRNVCVVLNGFRIHPERDELVHG